jgi:hypothetical protein
VDGEVLDLFAMFRVHNYNYAYKSNIAILIAYLMDVAQATGLQPGKVIMHSNRLSINPDTFICKRENLDITKPCPRPKGNDELYYSKIDDEIYWGVRGGSFVGQHIGGIIIPDGLCDDISHQIYLERVFS